MAYLYGVELNNDSKALYTTTGSNHSLWTGLPLVDFKNAAGNAVDRFNNVIAASYGSDIDYLNTNHQAWRFSFQNGNQGYTSKTTNYYAWAVAPGNVATVLEPAAIGFFGITSAGFLGLRRAVYG